MKLQLLSIVMGALLVAAQVAIADDAAQRVELLKSSPRILFLGDSITAGGGYVAAFEAWVVSQKWPHPPQIINAGLPSETVSGLSEEGHAGGKFPRPDVAERLDRVLKLTKPNLVFVCYGMNCGIYQPFDEKRFEKYQQGIQALKKAVEAAGAKLIVITPPHYDALKHPDQDYYNGVLDRYSEWLLQQREHGWQVIDLHGPMTQAIASKRQRDPQFIFAGDGVHPSDAGHWFIAQQLIAWFGDQPAAETTSPSEMLKSKGISADVWLLIQRRMSVLRDAYVATAGHKRPGVAKGQPLDEANRQAAELTAQINKLLAP